MKRITPEEVLEAYEKTSLKPMQGEYFPKGGCACGLGAYLSAAGFEQGNNDNENEWIEKLGFKDKYRAGFANGFDGNYTVGKNDIWETGFKDGNAAWEAVKHLAEVTP